MSKLILDGLNPQQKEAIVENGGPLLILAGAGSGKTRVITHKYAYIADKLSPASILAVTFTNKAAGEMRDRIQDLIKKDLRNAWIGTFHSQCNKLLRSEISVLGYGNDFTIYDSEDQCNLIRHILKEFKIHEGIYKGIQSRISSLKSEFVTPEDFVSNGEGYGFEERLARVYMRYQDELKRCNALDFDDLIMLTIKLFETYPAVLQKYQKKFKHIIVDEFQDTNLAQYKLLKLLSGSSRNLCVVGDDDQSIYGFRGANIKNILSFEQDFPDAKVIKLEQNYRSTDNILNVCGCVLKGMSARRDKKIWSDRQGGEKVSRCNFSTDKDEAKYIAKMIREFYLKGMYEYKNFSVLYRINLQSRVLEDAMRQERIPYRVVGGMSFYQRKEIKDIIAYMRLVQNQNDNVSMRRIINVPTRGIGASTLTKIESHAKKNSTSLFDSASDIIKNGNLAGSAKEKLQSFVSIIETLKGGTYAHAGELIKSIIEKTSYLEGIEEKRRANLDEFILSSEGRAIAELMDTLALVQISDEHEETNAVTLCTLHSAKGLEFPVVFVSGIEEGVLPYFKAQTPHEIDEERRLLYVGMTRAKDFLWLTSSRKRRLYAKVQDQEPSRFLASIPEGSCHTIEKVVRTAPTLVKNKIAVKRLKTMKQAYAYAIGSRVRHPKWGVGVIRDCSGQGDEQKITVNFPEIGVKRLALKFANLEKIQ